ncbi:Protein quiver [Echinococcus granulosus]|uniref:UPAR/Ly6 domain-containing protein qvr n=1 Tax=Echinococcus granulosus TaxID=6210 RepID=A0A068W7A7_ECHGR|nr:Protein quiver [Echinococcus granulosus]CDS15511.1 protein quiver [Echinococcus granulosus]
MAVTLILGNRIVSISHKSKIIFIILLVLLQVVFFCGVAPQEPVPCAPRKISCFFCNSSKLKGCEDPFPKRDMFSPHLPTVDCYEDCFKWLYIDYQQKHQLIRGCSSQLILKIDRHLICMYESKGRGGYICFCSAEKCNPGGVAETSPRAMALIFAATLMLLHGVS